MNVNPRAALQENVITLQLFLDVKQENVGQPLSHLVTFFELTDRYV